MEINNKGIDALHVVENKKDPGRISEERAEKYAAQRGSLLRAALVGAMADKEALARSMYHGDGVWWPEMAPLTGAERTAILDELRHMWAIPSRPPGKR